MNAHTETTGATALPALRLHLPSDPARLLRARARILDYLHAQGVAEPIRRDVVVAVDEAMTNVVRHSGSPELRVVLRFEGADLVAEIRDRGKGFDTTSFHPDRVPDLGATGGRGLYLIARLMDDLRLCCDGGLEVRVVKRGALADEEKPHRRQFHHPGERRHDDDRRAELLDEIDEGFFALDWDYRYIHVNAMAARAVGMSPDAMLGRSIWELFPGVADTAQGKAVRDALELGRYRIVEFQRADGSGWWESRVYPTPSGVSVFSHQIDERKRTEREREKLLTALQASEERYRELVQYANSAIVRWAADGSITFINEYAERLFGWSAEEAIGKPVMILAPQRESTGADLRELDRAILADPDRHVANVNENVTRDGRRLWMSWTNRAIRDDEGRILEILAVGNDVTELKQAEEALRASEQRFRGVFQNGAVGMALGDLSGRLLLVNGAFCELTGYDDAELQGRDFRDLTYAPDQVVEEHLMAEVLRGERSSYHLEKRYVRKDGSLVWVDFQSGLVTDADGRAAYGVGLARDITERKRTEEDLQRQRAAAEANLEAMRRLQSLGTRFVREGELETVLGEIVETGMTIAGSDFGSCQLVDPANGELRIRAHRGLPAWWLDYWDHVAEGQGTCGTALRRKEQVVVEDVCESQIFAGTPALDVQLRAGVRGVVSTPLTGSDGRLLGMISQHFRRPHRPDERVLSLLDLLAVQAVVIVERARNAQSRRETEARSRQIGRATRIGFFEWNAARGTSYWSPEYYDLLGLEPGTDTSWERWLGCVHPDDRDRVAQNAAALLERGRSKGQVRGHKDEYRFRRADGSVVWVVTDASLDMVDGEPIVHGVIRDITAHRRAQEAARQDHETMRLLLRAADTLRQSLDLREVLERVARLVLESGGHSRATISLWDEARGCVETRISHGASPVPVGTRSPLDGLSAPARQAIRTGKPTLIDYEALSIGSRGIGDVFPSRLALAVPLYYGEDLVGLLAVDDAHERREFSERELAFLEAIGAHAAAAIAHARLFEEQKRIAATLQQNLIHPLPRVDGLDLAALSLPANRSELVGGDFHDVFRLPYGTVVALVGDVVGKGMVAARYTETVHSAVRALALAYPEPARILSQADLLLQDEGGEQFASAQLLLLDPLNGHGSLGSAGHPPAIHLSGVGARLLEGAKGTLLGLGGDDFVTEEIRLLPGEAVVFYTDGLTDARGDGGFFSEQGVLAAVRGCAHLPAQAIVDRLRGAVTDFADELRDDLEILVVKRAPASGR